MRKDERSEREISRGKRKREGDKSADLARTLMQLKEALLKKLVIDQEMRLEIDKARRITAPVARRRAERTLAGDLRRWDLLDLAAKLSKVHESNNLDTRLLHDAEEWRARLIEEGPEIAKDLPGGIDDDLIRMIQIARRERDTGKPPGAARKLFRFVMDRLKSDPEATDEAATDDADDNADDDDEDEDFASDDNENTDDDAT